MTIELDPVIHATARLRIVAALAALPEGDAVTFPKLQDLLDMTAGNLSTHARKLEDAQYVTIEKSFSGRSPVTYLSLTPQGRLAFSEYTKSLRDLLGGTNEFGDV